MKIQQPKTKLKDGLIATGVDLDWATATITIERKSITINAYPRPVGVYCSGYSYTAHIKLDPNANWRREIRSDAREWELAQRDTPLWETVRGEDYNYLHSPSEGRPPIHRLLKALKTSGQTFLAERIAEAYRIRIP